MSRPDGRQPDELRPITLERGANPYAEGSCLARFGGTLVLSTATVQDGVPTWRRGKGMGWLTAEYAMLPRATSERTPRERRGSGGRTSEIQRLIGRSLRAALASFDFGERTITIDCDVLQADGGTRTAAITGGAVALADACVWLADHADVPNPFSQLVAAVSVGIVDGEACLDLSYAEDHAAEVDANIVVADPDRYVEVQATSEGELFDRPGLDRLLALAQIGVRQLFGEQRRVLNW
ncbi:MAG: ribonuclease PH [Gemmatimonadales bacterium]|nr:ribonuclease PH [Gemmatimonadales bacterium]NIN50206.1 ribonuclease PH [Gemmatimonadales bacterium]NIP07670.1 ribonuclease PH [Gemmatimonadales bacterium]NIR01822.1 ribonuclease PH [Gemmatimonadales bacterium]NIS65725.1 ribonuclease PH [Gemmatimonadales bacterium]